MAMVNFAAPSFAASSATWVERTPSQAQDSPPGRIYHAMAYNAARGRVVLFGGVTNSAYLQDTWEWDGSTWQNRKPSVSPSARSNHAMAYDAARGRVVLFGGSDSNGRPLADVWEWDGSTWQDKTPSVSPPARYLHAMAYDAARGRVVLFGGTLGDESFRDTWEWDGNNWQNKTPVRSPLPRLGHAMAYDAGRGRVVLFGGQIGEATYLRDTWEWDGSTWVSKTPTASSPNPSARFAPGMAYDATRSRVVLFGGFDGNLTSTRDTWEWDGRAWADQTPPVSSSNPPARFSPTMAYDAARGRVVLFGGGDRIQYFHDTWELSDSNVDADLSVTNVATPARVRPGSRVNFAVSVLNSGPATAQSLSLSIRLPLNVSLLSFVPATGWTTSQDGDVISATKTSMAAGEKAVFTLNVQPGANMTTGTSLKCAATLSSPSFDPDIVDRSATGTAAVIEAGSLTVDVVDDSSRDTDSQTSLREAVSFANEKSGDDALLFDLPAGSVVGLQNGPLAIDSNVVIDAGTAPRLVVSGNNNSIVFQIGRGAQVTLANLRVSNGKGGGIANNGGQLLLNNVTLSGNTSSNGGGLTNNGGSISISNSTLSGNAAEGNGGAVYNASGTLTLINSTLSGNTAGNGGAIFNAGVVNLRNSIVASNVAALNADVTGSYNNQGANLIGGSATQAGLEVDAGGKPLLKDNGGPTLTIALVSGSPALDAAQSTLMRDQRGLVRPSGAASDIGSLEAQVPLFDLNGQVPGVNFAVTFTEDAGPVALADSGALLSDADSSTLAGATISLNIAPDGASESLAAVTTGTSIVARYDAATRTLSLVGTDSLAHYIQVLRSITYNNTDQAPSTSNRVATFIVNDGATKAMAATTIRLLPVNDAPVPRPDTAATDEDTSVLIDVKANDSDDQSVVSALSIAEVTPSSDTHGSVVIENNRIRFTPDANFTGQSTFAYTLSDGELTRSATVSVLVRPIDDAPIAINDAYAVTKGQALSIPVSGVLFNDSDADGDRLSATLVGNPAHGNVTLRADGSFIYTPVAGYVGQDVFTYRATDGGLGSATTSVSLTVSSDGTRFLSLSAPQKSFKEGTSLTASLLLSRPSATNVVVTLSNSDPSAAIVPTRLTIAAGRVGVAFTIRSIDNAMVDVPRALTIEATTPNYGTASLNLVVSDNDAPRLTLTVAPPVISENGGPAAAKVTLTRNAQIPLRVPVRLNSSDVSEARVPTSLTFPSGAASMTFFVAAIDDRVVDGPRNVRIAVSIAGFPVATTSVRVLDRGLITRGLKASVSANAAIFTERVSGSSGVMQIGIVGAPFTHDLDITLESSDVSAVTVPRTVRLRAGQSSVSVAFRVLDDAVVNGVRVVYITAKAPTFASTFVALQVRDNDQVQLGLSFSPARVSENVGRVNGTVVLRNIAPGAARTITLSSSDPRRVTVPASVLVAAGKTSVSFVATVRDNVVIDGTHRVIITASSTGTVAAKATLDVLDNDTPVASP